MSQATPQTRSRRYVAYLTLGALGVVFGDIGTSPLYAIKECFSGDHGVPVAPENIYGVVSLIFWALVTLVSIKYLSFVMRADNRGEGGVMALMALVYPRGRLGRNGKQAYPLLLGLFGAALLYGDGVITPAISVLSAIEGLSVVAPHFEHYIIPLTVAVLMVLFFVQSTGTGRIGLVFGPVILVWFLTLGILGIRGILLHPDIVFAAMNPLSGINFLIRNGWGGFIILGPVFLAVTGTEALYADMGHFGRKPISIGWYGVVFPGLCLNYFGQGALLLSDPSAVKNPFYLLAPTEFVLPLLILATLATVIASQALISGAFSLTRQAVQLGFLPRLRILHTSSKEIGQIYIPPVNAIGILATIGLVLMFRSSSNLAAAYGIAVSLTMVITSILFCLVAKNRWRWPAWQAWSCLVIFLSIDLMFVGANSAKLFHGGWVTIAMAIVFFTLMTTWKRGRDLLQSRLQTQTTPFDQFLASIKTDSTIRVPGTAIFMTRTIERTPPALIHNVRHNKVVHKTVVLLMVVTEELPHLSNDERVEVTDVGDGFYCMVLHYGFMEQPNVPEVLQYAREFGLDINLAEVTYFFGRETLLATSNPGMALWREHLFTFMTQNALRATAFYQIPANQVIEIGLQVEL